MIANPIYSFCYNLLAEEKLGRISLRRENRVSEKWNDRFGFYLVLGFQDPILWLLNLQLGV
jgi:hypothetical protein